MVGDNEGSLGHHALDSGIGRRFRRRTKVIVVRSSIAAIEPTTDKAGSDAVQVLLVQVPEAKLQPPVHGFVPEGVKHDVLH